MGSWLSRSATFDAIYETTSQQLSLRITNQDHYMIVVHLLAEDEVELGVESVIHLFVSRPEEDHDTVLQEVVEHDRIGIQALRF